MTQMFTQRRFIAISIALCSSILFFGCATMFSSKHQKITLETATHDATIKFEKEAVAKNSKKIKVDKYKYYYTASIRKEGYKSMNYAFQINKRSPTYAFTALNIVVPWYGWFVGFALDARNPKTRRFDRLQKVPALIPYESRKDNEKYMLINNTAFDAKGSDITWHNYLSINRFKDDNHSDSRSVRKHNKSKDRDDIKVDNTIFTSALNNTLKDMHFIDTTETIFPNINNSVYLNATVRKITVHYVDSRWFNYYASHPHGNRTTAPNNLVSIELAVDWDVLDYYKQKIDSAKTDKKSDLFLITFKDSKSDFDEKILSALEDNMEYSVMEIRKKLSDKGILNVTNKKEEVIPTITLSKPVIDPASRMNDFLKSSVTVKVDDGHGSGVVVSADGYIITAYHVVAGSKKITVMLNDTMQADAEVIRKNTEADLALIKINKTGLNPLLLSQNPDPEIGVDVWAMGTPKSIELGKSVSKGILSGLRKANNVNYLQTDVSINGGNSGGALISKDGTVLGIVTAKLVGIGTEGLGFAISAQEIFNKLKISYQ